MYSLPPRLGLNRQICECVVPVVVCSEVDIAKKSETFEHQQQQHKYVEAGE